MISQNKWGQLNYFILVLAIRPNKNMPNESWQFSTWPKYLLKEDIPRKVLLLWTFPILSNDNRHTKVKHPSTSRQATTSLCHKPSDKSLYTLPQFFSHPKSYFFCELKPHAKFQKKQKRKNTINSGQRTEAAQTKIVQFNMMVVALICVT
jgi:hypothetical protein